MRNMDHMSDFVGMLGYGRIFNIAGSPVINRNLLFSRNLQPCATLTGKALEKLGIPPKPKKPLNPFFKFMKTERSKVVAEEPNLKPRDVAKKLAQMWANYDPTEKEAQLKAYNLELLDYSKRYMIYKQSITPEQRRIMKNAQEKPHGKIIELKYKKKLEELGKPRRPPTAFILYMQEKSLSKSKDSKDIGWRRNVTEEWRKMTTEEKEKYHLACQKLTDQYRKDINEWEMGMVRLGHMELLRKCGLSDLKVYTEEKPK